MGITVRVMHFITRTAMPTIVAIEIAHQGTLIGTKTSRINVVEWLWICLGVLAALPVIALLIFHGYVVCNYVGVVSRIFQEKPLFMVPFGKPVEGAEEITLTTPEGFTLNACYLHTKRQRKGVILFGLEFGSTKWSCAPYTEFLIDAGYDIFAFEPRGQGASKTTCGYEPLQWVTEYEISDFRTALAYLKSRPDHDPRGIGLFGLSKGGSAGLIAAAGDDFIRCCTVDGVFAVDITVLPYMYQFVLIYTRVKFIVRFLPIWYLRHILHLAIRKIERERRCRYVDLERYMRKVSPRPLLMIHGGGDNYIKPDMAKKLFELAGEPKEFWLVEKAKHNQAFHLAADEYKRRVLEFFDKHLQAQG